MSNNQSLTVPQHRMRPVRLAEELDFVRAEFQVYGGYRFGRHLAVEAGARELEEVHRRSAGHAPWEVPLRKICLFLPAPDMADGQNNWASGQQSFNHTLPPGRSRALAAR